MGLTMNPLVIPFSCDGGTISEEVPARRNSKRFDFKTKVGCKSLIGNAKKGKYILLGIKSENKKVKVW